MAVRRRSPACRLRAMLLSRLARAGSNCPSCKWTTPRLLLDSGQAQVVAGLAEDRLGLLKERQRLLRLAPGPVQIAQIQPGEGLVHRVAQLLQRAMAWLKLSMAASKWPSHAALCPG